jgi:hypothetical protein
MHQSTKANCSDTWALGLVLPCAVRKEQENESGHGECRSLGPAVGLHLTQLFFFFMPSAR